MRIFLVGFMGCGKSYTGKRLADLLAYSFIDLDDLIEEIEGKSIVQIFEEKGEDYFRNVEKEVLRSLTNQENIVIACGGGVPCFHQNMEWMKNNGKTIYLSLPPAILENRLAKEATHRPLIKDLTAKGELLSFIENKVSERNEFYQKADFIFNADNETLAPWLAIQQLLFWT